MFIGYPSHFILLLFLGATLLRGSQDDYSTSVTSNSSRSQLHQQNCRHIFGNLPAPQSGPTSNSPDFEIQFEVAGYSRFLNNLLGQKPAPAFLNRLRYRIIQELPGEWTAYRRAEVKADRNEIKNRHLVDLKGKTKLRLTEDQLLEIAVQEYLFRDSNPNESNIEHEGLALQFKDIWKNLTGENKKARQEALALLSGYATNEKTTHTLKAYLSYLYKTLGPEQYGKEAFTLRIILELRRRGVELSPELEAGEAFIQPSGKITSGQWSDLQLLSDNGFEKAINNLLGMTSIPKELFDGKSRALKLRMLDHPNPIIAERAAYSLRNDFDPKVLHTFRLRLSHPETHPIVAGAIIQALRGRTAPEAQNILIAIWKTKRLPPYIQKEARRSLILTTDNNGWPNHLNELLHQNSGNTFASDLVEIGRHLPSASGDTFIKALSCNHSSIRKTAADLLETVERSDILKLIQFGLNSGIEDVRIRTTRALANRVIGKSEPDLIQLFSEQATQEITKERFLADIKKAQALPTSIINTEAKNPNTEVIQHVDRAVPWTNSEQYLSNNTMINRFGQNFGKETQLDAAKDLEQRPLRVVSRALQSIFPEVRLAALKALKNRGEDPEELYAPLMLHLVQGITIQERMAALESLHHINTQAARTAVNQYAQGKNVEKATRLGKNELEERKLTERAQELLSASSFKSHLVRNVSGEIADLRRSIGEAESRLPPEKRIQDKALPTLKLSENIYSQWEALNFLRLFEKKEVAAQNLVDGAIAREANAALLGYKLTLIADDPKTGLKVGLYESADGDMHIIFGGTQFQGNVLNPAFIADMIVNLTGGQIQLESQSKVFKEIVARAKERSINHSHGDLILGGHSLGGIGVSHLASELAKHMEVSQINNPSSENKSQPQKLLLVTLNSAQQMNLERQRRIDLEDKHIQSLNLSNSGDFATRITGDRIGPTITLPQEGLSILETHSMDPMIPVLKEANFAKDFIPGPPERIRGHRILYPIGRRIGYILGRTAYRVRWWLRRREIFEKLRAASELYAEQHAYKDLNNPDPFRDARETIANDIELSAREREKLQKLNAETELRIQEHLKRLRSKPLRNT